MDEECEVDVKHFPKGGMVATCWDAGEAASKACVDNCPN